MKLIAYPTTSKPCPLKPANPKRLWMDVAANKNPYRCLPLSMANAWGWEILSTAKFIAEWNGGNKPSDVKITTLEGVGAPDPHFGEATLTWHAGYVFKTPFPYGLYVTGAPNHPKPVAIPLSGVVETHWLPFTFTMNWRFTQPGQFTMDIGEPFCQIFPIDMNTFDNLEAEIRSLSEPEAKEFSDEYWEWNFSRAKFAVDQRSGKHGPDAWQKNYFRGTYASDGRKCPVHNVSEKEISTHRTKPNVPTFTDKQSSPFSQPQEFTDKMKTLNAARITQTKNMGKQKITNTLETKLSVDAFAEIKIPKEEPTQEHVTQPAKVSTESREDKLKRIQAELMSKQRKSAEPAVTESREDKLKRIQSELLSKQKPNLKLI